jgi:hypothetical protein
MAASIEGRYREGRGPADVVRKVIARIWHGWATRERGRLRAAAPRPRVPQDRGARRRVSRGYVLRDDAGDEVEFVTMTLFDSLDAVRAFAGDDHEAVVVPPEARALLSHFDARSRHYETLIEPPQRTSIASPNE